MTLERWSYIPWVLPILSEREIWFDYSIVKGSSVVLWDLVLVILCFEPLLWLCNQLFKLSEFCQGAPCYRKLFRGGGPGSMVLLRFSLCIVSGRETTGLTCSGLFPHHSVTQACTCSWWCHGCHSLPQAPTASSCSDLQGQPGQGLSAEESLSQSKALLDLEAVGSVMTASRSAKSSVYFDSLLVPLLVEGKSSYAFYIQVYHPFLLCCGLGSFITPNFCFNVQNSNRVQDHRWKQPKNYDDSQVPVTHTCSPSYLGGWDQEDHSSRPSQANSSRNPQL
jgi:hypothetical protein